MQHVFLPVHARSATVHRHKDGCKPLVSGTGEGRASETSYCGGNRLAAQPIVTFTPCDAPAITSPVPQLHTLLWRWSHAFHLLGQRPAVHLPGKPPATQHEPRVRYPCLGHAGQCTLPPPACCLLTVHHKLPSHLPAAPHCPCPGKAHFVVQRVRQPDRQARGWRRLLPAAEQPRRADVPGGALLGNHHLGLELASLPLSRWAACLPCTCRSLAAWAA